ncbi:ring-cleaving dioxygenase [Metabacillus herbersteinensis]|uniref:Ring-cleaving dioxygenase n=1 Tax=Metabacillus herbersteinensis TaxID=283816 RepID=A0ABV6GKA9_9BACI
MELLGNHHVSAMTADASLNLEFYTKVLGMRLVKKTVNQDDTSVYHLFYGDEKGNPGTELTFFEIPRAAKNHEGVSSISSISLRVRDNQALAFWKEQFGKLIIPHEEIVERGGRLTLAFQDPEGQRLLMVSDQENKGVKGGTHWKNSPISEENAIRGLGPIRLTVRKPEKTVAVLTNLLGFREKESYASLVQNQPAIRVFETGEGGSGAEVHIEERSDLPFERLGRGGVHHVAFRVKDDEELKQWIERIAAAGFQHSGYVDRFYFHSLYFREPNGILFELATDGPGFDTDEQLDYLGETLALPPFLEPKRQQIEAKLKPLNTK